MQPLMQYRISGIKAPDPQMINAHCGAEGRNGQSMHYKDRAVTNVQAWISIKRTGRSETAAAGAYGSILRVVIWVSSLQADVFLRF